MNPGDPNALQSVLVVPGGQLVTGSPPAPTGGANAPVVNSNQSSTSSSTGGQAQIPFNFSSRSGYNNCFVQVRGATNGYFNIPANNSANNGTITIPIQIPESVGAGQFCVQYCIADAQGRVSNIREFCITVTENSGNTGNGKATFTIGGQTHNGECTSIPSVVSGGGIDVIMINSSGTSSFTIYRMPQSGSGSTSFGDGWEQRGTFGLALVPTTSALMGTRTGGTVTKTAANKFSFSGTVYDLISNQSLSVSGSGTY